MKNYKQFLELKKKVKKYANGGDVLEQSSEEAGIEAKARREVVLKNAGISSNQSPEEIEIEAAEKRKRELERANNTYSNGGQVQESQQKQYQAKEYFGKGASVPTGGSNTMGVRMSDGGWADLAAKLREAFKSPPLPKSKEETQEEKYARIRKENQERAMGKRSSLQSMDEEAQKRGYARGGNVEMDLGDISITPSTPYPGEEEEAQDVTSASTSGQIQRMIDEALAQDQQQAPPQEVAPVEEEPYLKPMTEDGDFQNQALAAKYAKENARNLEGMTLNKDEALKESGQDLESQYAKENQAAQKASEQGITPKENIPVGEGISTVPSFDPISALKNAQEGRNRSQMWNQLGAIAERGAAGWAGIKPTQQETFKENMVIAQQAVDDVKDRIKQQGDDPNSMVSRNFRQYLEKFSGHPVDPNTTANSGKEILPLVFKDYEQKFITQTNKDLKQQALEQRAFQSKENREAEERKYKFLAGERKETEKGKALDREAAGKIKLEEKQEQFDRKRLDDLGKKLTSETASSRSAFGRAATNLRAAEAIEALVDQARGNLNTLDSRQIYELSKSLDSLLSAGQSTISGTEHLIPHTIRGNISKIAEMIANKPIGAQQGEFVKRIIETVEREKDIAKDQIKRAQGKILGPYKETLKRRPSDAKDILEPHGLDFLMSEGSAKESSKSEKKSDKKLVKKGYNAKTNQTQLIYDDGSKEIKEGKL